MKIKYLLLGLITFIGITLSATAKAICPICVVAVGVGLGFSRWLGIDDTVSSIWIGALLVALIAWTLVEMKKHNWKFPFDAIVISIAYYALTFIPLYYAGIIGHPLNKIFGIDKIVFGSAVGTIIFLLSYFGLHLYLKKINNGKSFFPYQKVVIPVIVLLLTSLTFYLLIIWRII